MQQKKEFIFKRPGKEESFTGICRDFGIRTKTGYKQVNRFKERGMKGLAEESRAPKNKADKIDRVIKKTAFETQRKTCLSGRV
ncbi:MAG: hypothetical protein LBO04_03305 [Spirochaetaceae bacterium]|jgi:transposase|nr:hypothetical protein [Spirochaetaceae bacterium]